MKVNFHIYKNIYEIKFKINLSGNFKEKVKITCFGISKGELTQNSVCFN